MDVVRRQGEWLDAQVGADRVMMSVKDGHYLGITGTGARIWDLLERPSTVEAICADLVREFVVAPDVCEQEVRAFLGQLSELGAVSIESSAE